LWPTIHEETQQGMTVETQNPNLPEGWTYHELSGRPFWYHAATNTIQQEPPAAPPPPPAPALYPCPPEPASEPVPLAAQPPLPPAVEIQPGVYSSPQSRQTPPAFPNLPMAQVVQISAAPPTPVPAYTTPLAAQAMQASPQAMPQPYAHPHSPMQATAQEMQAQALQSTAQAFAQPALPIYARQPEQSMVSLQVLVPEPGLRAGQQLAFTAPPQRLGQPSQPMVVTVNQEVLPGSVITVKYPAPAVSAGSRIPQPSVTVPSTTDDNHMVWTWLLYAAGCVGCFCFAPLGMLLWVVASSLYFCKPAQERAQMSRTRWPAWVAAITAISCCTLVVLMVPVAFVFADETPGHHFGFGKHGMRFHHGPMAQLRGARHNPHFLMNHFFDGMQRASKESEPRTMNGRPWELPPVPTPMPWYPKSSDASPSPKPWQQPPAKPAGASKPDFSKPWGKEPIIFD